MQSERFDSRVLSAIRDECGWTWERLADELGLPEASVMRWRRKDLNLDALVFLLRFASSRGLKSTRRLQGMLEKACGPYIVVLADASGEKVLNGKGRGKRK